MTRAKINQRDLDAWRIGVREQVRHEIYVEDAQASIERNLQRRRLHRVKLIPGRDLRVGDTTAEPIGVMSYVADWDIVDVRHEDAPNGEPLRPDSIWISYASKFGSGGQIIYSDSQILVEDREV